MVGSVNITLFVFSVAVEGITQSLPEDISSDLFADDVTPRSDGPHSLHTWLPHVLGNFVVLCWLFETSDCSVIADLVPSLSYP